MKLLDRTFTKPQWNEWGGSASNIRTKNLKVMARSRPSPSGADARRITRRPSDRWEWAADAVRQVDLAGRKRPS